MQKYVAKVKLKFKVYGIGLILLLLGGTGVHFDHPCYLL